MKQPPVLSTPTLAEVRKRFAVWRKTKNHRDRIPEDLWITAAMLSQKANWLKPDGGLKDMSCRVAMLKMEKDGHLPLPPPKTKHTKPYKKPRTLWAIEQPEITKKAGEFNLILEVVDNRSSALWNEFIDRYHYLGYKTLPGAQLRYFVKSEGQILVLLGFGAAAWKTAPRDTYIGWDKPTRNKNLHLVVNNARFLTLPWVHSKNLGFKIYRWRANEFVPIWSSAITIDRYCWRPLSKNNAFKEPVIRQQIGSGPETHVAKRNWEKGLVKSR